MDIVFHYPPELTQLLIQTIPLLCPSKKDVLSFFKGAGVLHLQPHSPFAGHLAVVMLPMASTLSTVSFEF
ncbi:MAG TPA: hypothetical protein VMT53_07645 [Terriglobales bacterium]|nr:hypothetical protein [Terriglobales bacterium]